MSRQALVGGLDTLLTREPRKRIRLLQWATTAAVYLLSGLALGSSALKGLIPGPQVVGWSVFVALGLAGFYAAMRSGWSERLADPALTDLQIVFAVPTVMWGYLMAGEVRSATLFTLVLILTFGAFSSTWRRMAALTVYALAWLALTVWWRQRGQGDAPDARDWNVDLSNLVMMAIVLPTISWLAARLSAMRARLHQQRGELGKALARIQELATRDELTGLANRRRLLELLELERQREARAGQAFSLAVIDLDHFKAINDRHGHPVGDRVLRHFAREALTTIRTCDILGRWGGEEFVLLMPSTRVTLARLGVERLRARAESLQVEHDGQPVTFTLSAGVVEHRQGESVAETIARADLALYLAKEQGRNRVVSA